MRDVDSAASIAARSGGSAHHPELNPSRRIAPRLAPLGDGPDLIAERAAQIHEPLRLCPEHDFLFAALGAGRTRGTVRCGGRHAHDFPSSSAISQRSRRKDGTNLVKRRRWPPCPVGESRRGDTIPVVSGTPNDFGRTIASIKEWGEQSRAHIRREAVAVHRTEFSGKSLTDSAEVLAQTEDECRQDREITCGQPQIERRSGQPDRRRNTRPFFGLCPVCDSPLDAQRRCPADKTNHPTTDPAQNDEPLTPSERYQRAVEKRDALLRDRRNADRGTDRRRITSQHPVRRP
jgi:hypothetical protein